MKIFLLTASVLLSFLCDKSFSQISYQYLGKQDHNGIKLITLKSNNDTTLITQGINSKNNVERKVISSQGDHKFQYKFNGDEVWNEDNKTIAQTVGFYNLIFPDGKHYECKRTSSTEWKYVSNGIDIVRGVYKKTGENKTVEITWLSPEKENKELLLTMSQIYGIKIIRLKTITPILLGISMSATLLGAIAQGQ